MQIYRPTIPKLLLPVPRTDWQAPSRAQPKDRFGHETRTLFRLRARLSDGHVRWTGWFDDRDDFDAFLWAVVLWRHEGVPVPRPLWDLPRPAWHPDLDDGSVYAADTVQILTSSAGSNQTWSRPGDFNAAANSIEVLGGGGSGALGQATTYNATGAGSGAWSSIVNFAAGSSETYQIGLGGVCAAISTTGNQTSPGNDGGDSWFGDAMFGTADVAAKGGQKGNAAITSTTVNGGAGGLASAGIGSSKRDGSRGGNINGTPSSRNATGGGGAPGPAGSGSNGGDLASPSGSSSAGGNSGDGAAGAGAATSADGSNGTVWQAAPARGPGGGGCGYRFTAGESGDGSAGGNYGAGGGGAGKNGWSSGSAQAGSGTQGIIIVTYTPVVPAAGDFLALLN